MKLSLAITILSAVSLFAFVPYVKADEVCDAQGIYEELNAKTTGDMSRCVVDIKEPKIKDCPLPKNFTGGERPASHVVLLMDAIGFDGCETQREVEDVDSETRVFAIS